MQEQALSVIASAFLLQFLFVFSLQAYMVVHEIHGYSKGGEKRGYQRMQQRLLTLLRDA